jgi:hypothetical protein
MGEICYPVAGDPPEEQSTKVILLGIAFGVVKSLRCLVECRHQPPDTLSSTQLHPDEAINIFHHAAANSPNEALVVRKGSSLDRDVPRRIQTAHPKLLNALVLALNNLYKARKRMIGVVRFFVHPVFCAI